MKKLVLSIIAIAAFGFGVNAQVKGQLDVLRELGEGMEFKEYYSIYEGDDGKWKGTAYKAISILKFEYNMHNKLSAFSMIDKETGEKSIYKSYGYMLPNHYTEPSIFHIAGPNKGFLYVDGLFYSLEYVKDPNAVTKINIEFILIPEKKKEEDTGEKKKLTMKEKIAAAKAMMTETESTTPKEIADKDHIAIIEKYLADMKPIQEKATASFSPEVKQEIADIEKADEEFEQKLKDQNQAYSARLNAQKGGGSASNYTIENTSSSSIQIITDSGSTTTLSAGSKTTYICSTDVYYCVGGNSKGALITDGEDACGQTISIN